MKSHGTDSSIIGFLYGIAAFTLWGFLPLFWKLLDAVGPLEILAHRILWSFVFVLGILWYKGQLRDCKKVLEKGSNIVRIIFATILISINWGVYIWAVNSGHVVEASMGYYINPLIVVLLAVLVLKEKLTVLKIISIIFAAFGVGIITIRYGQIPWISLILACSFALYGLMKKKIMVGSSVGLAVETGILFPLTFGFIMYRQLTGVGAFGEISLLITVVLICSGIVTALPLLFFAEAARRIPLSSVGFLQYIAPSISLVLGVFVFKEQFTFTHFISFGFIWCGLLIYSYSEVQNLRNKYNDRLGK